MNIIKTLRYKFDAILMDVARHEFPVGIKVRWREGDTWRHGVVTGYYLDNGDIEVSDPESGLPASVRAEDLEAAA